jgi:GTPase SAR1 family protein
VTSPIIQQLLADFRRAPEAQLDLSETRFAKADWNDLWEVADEFGSVKSLRIGSIAEAAVPRAVAFATRLRDLRELQASSLTDAGVRALADKLPALTSLNLTRCYQVTDTGLQAVADKLTALTSLNLARCDKVTDAGLRAVADKLTALTSLNLTACQQVTDAGLRAVVDRLGNLRYLNLSEINSLRIPNELLQSPFNVAAIRAYYWRGEREGKRQLNEAKLIVVGNESVGKSALVNYLVFGIPCSDTAKTEGVSISERINIANWDVNAQATGETPLRLNVWDFGGQEVLYETHKFFLTARSVYLVVLEARRENTGDAEVVLHEWMRAVRNRGGEEAPVIVVVNKAEPPHDLRLDEPRLRKEYPAIRGFARTSCRDPKEYPDEGGKGIAELRKEIVRVVRNDLPHVRDWFPLSYFNVKEKVGQLAREESTLTLARYTAICIESKVTAELEQNSLLTLLDQIGVVVRHSDATLLDPNWLTTAVYRVLTHSLVVKDGGEFVRADLGRLLADLPSAGRYSQRWWPYIADMMVRFNLSFELSDQPGRYLVPLQLPTQEPELNWNEAKSLRFRYDYDSLPLGLLPRFIGEMHRYLTPRRTAWVSGVVLSVDGCHVLVRGDRKDRRVHVFVVGSAGERRGALAIVRGAFARVHELHADLKIKAMVPVDVLGNPDAAVEFEQLLTSERQKIKTIAISGATRPYSVKKLLEGVGPEPSQPKRARAKAGDTYNMNFADGAQAILAPNLEGSDIMGKSTKIEIKGSQVGAFAADGATATNTGNQTQQIFPPQQAQQFAALLDDILHLVRQTTPSEIHKPIADATAKSTEEAKAVATSAAPDKGKLTAAWDKVKVWVTTGLGVGLFTVEAAKKVEDLVTKCGGLLGG